MLILIFAIENKKKKYNMLHMHHKKTRAQIQNGFIIAKIKPQALVSETTVGLSSLVTGLRQIYRALAGPGGRREVLPGEKGYSVELPGLNHLVMENGQEVVEVLAWYPGCLMK